MKLSIIIPVYNVERYLRECLDSVFIQDLTGCEVIVVNDGSTDACSTIIDEYRSAYPSVLRVINKKNGGLSSARNAGIDIAHGEYVFFVDSDDYLLPKSINIILASIMDYPSSFIYLDGIITDKGKRLVSFPFCIKEDSDSISLFNSLYKEHITILPNAFSYVFSRSFLLNNHLKYTEGLTHEDAFFKYQVYLSRSSVTVIHVDSPLYVYRIGREGSISTQKRIKNFLDQQSIRKKVDQLITERNIPSAYLYNSLFQAFINCMIEASRSNPLSSQEFPFDDEDKRIMRKGVLSSFEFKLWILACIKPKLLVNFLENNLSDIQRRFINITVSAIVFINEKIRRI